MPEVAEVTITDIAKLQLYYGDYTQYGYDSSTSLDRIKALKGQLRWGQRPNTYLLNDFGRLLGYLVTEDYEKSTRYRQDARQSVDRVEPPETKLDVVKRIWEGVLPHRRLRITGNRIRTAISDQSSTTYAATDMSDGERVIFYLIGQALSAPENGIIVIDESELHLHRSIQATLWDKIEAERPDCLFVYLTHDLDFAASRVAATKICLRSFDGHAWD